MKKLVLTVVLSGAFISFNAHAWGNDGHRAVGAIADQLIQGSNAEQRVKALLLPGESLEKVSIWADCVKGSYCGPQSDEMVAYVTANPQHAEYHYTDVPFQNPHYHDHDAGTADNDIVQTLKQCIATLQGKGDKISNPHGFTPRQALLILTHLAGDVVQPLHVGAAFVDRNGAFVVPQKQAQVDAVNMFDARGGNNLLLDDIKLSAVSAQLIPAGPPETRVTAQAIAPRAPQTTRPFHSYWDTTVVSYVFRRIGARSPQEFAQLAIAGKPAVDVNSGDPVSWPYAWADQSLAVAKLAHAGVTAGAIGQQTSKTGEVYNVWALTVPDDYPVPSSAAAKTQLIQGGYNLAAVLQAIWP
ncbi:MULTISPECIES: S1/P1 nuclease [unclassified Duganella]|uniref:S1/P1 nuclease n=1 Tax=unclassified Duganella TaxID=2636909 RepID=UPI000E342B0B|nr:MULTISPECIES: S1/P1 nuclease [unclassified Duganella]RFP10882.1 phospholipase [Duganella sp. BJB475]RFP27090.1 phospholipase [Duganella sp. BJB476]